MRVMIEEIEHATATYVVVRMRENGRTIARPCEWHLQDLSNSRLRAVDHQDEPIGKVAA